jgi:ABC-type Mn2+/Zn2+ transport system permease subunit
VVGLYISYYLGITSGSAIVLTATLVFAVVFVARQRTARRKKI